MGAPNATERLVFRTWRDDDHALAWSLFGDPEVTALVGGPFDDAAVRARLATEITNLRTHGIQYWPLFLRTSDDFIGCCGLKPRTATVHELGFYLRPEHHGHGYAVEAGRAVIAYAFDVLGVDALFAGHHPENAGSRRVLERLGFRYVYDELYPPTGLQHPGYELARVSDRR